MLTGDCVVKSQLINMLGLKVFYLFIKIKNILSLRLDKIIRLTKLLISRIFIYRDYILLR